MNLDVIVVDGHRLTIDGIRSALERSEDIRVSATFTAAGPLLESLSEREPDVVLMNSELPDMDAMKCLDLIRRHHPAVKVGVLFADKDLDRIQTALAAGAAACVMKNVEPDDLPAAVHQVIDATVFTAAGFTAPVPAAPVGDPASLGELTGREMTMLKALARGLSNKAISRELWVTEQTVKFHLNNVYRKLGVPNRTAAARLAFSHGLLEEQQQQPATAGRRLVAG